MAVGVARGSVAPTALKEIDALAWYPALTHGAKVAEASDPKEDTRKNQRGSNASPSAQPHRATHSFRSRLCLSSTPQPTPTGLCH
jgi:hypothetical protein